MSGRIMDEHALGGAALVGLLAAVLCLGGCGTRRVTDTARTASEQLLVSAAADRAVAQLDFAPLANEKVFLDAAYFDSVDKGFVVSTVRNAAFAAGALIMPTPEEADVVLELRSGGVGVDRSDWLLGFPGLSSNASVAGTGVPLVIPEAALFKTVHQVGAARLSLFAYRRDTRRFLYQSGPSFGYSSQRGWWVFGAGPFLQGDVTPADPTAAETLGTPPPAPGVGGEAAYEPLPGAAAPEPPVE